MLDMIHQEIANRETIVTGGAENRNLHKSLHPSGLAIDIRTKDLQQRQASALHTSIDTTLGSCYDVVLESNHIHIEYDINNGRCSTSNPDLGLSLLERDSRVIGDYIQFVLETGVNNVSIRVSNDSRRVDIWFNRQDSFPTSREQEVRATDHVRQQGGEIGGTSSNQQRVHVDSSSDSTYGCVQCHGVPDHSLFAI